LKLRSLIAATLAVLAQAAVAQDLVALAPGNRALRVELPAEAFSYPGAGLAVDLDGYDVSLFSRLNGTVLEIDLETPLSAGRHSLSVLLFLADGQAEVLLDAFVDAPALDDSHWSLNTTFQTNYRADQEPSLDLKATDRATENGSLTFAGTKTSSNWELTSRADAVYDSHDAWGAADAWRLPSYRLSAAYRGATAEASAVAGNIKVAREDLLFSRFQRRGAAVGTSATSGRFDVQLFSVGSQPRNRFDGGYLVPRAFNDRSDGVSASVKLIEDYLEIGAGLVDGRSAIGGAGFNHLSDAVVYGGESWNVTIDSRPLEGSVWLHLEHAASSFDADGIGVGLPARSDDALHARLRLSSSGRFAAGPFAYWSADIQHKRVGLDFHSVANLSQPGNIELDTALLQAGFDSIAIDITLTEQRTNPHGDAWLPSQRLQQAGAELSYSPATLNLEKGVWKGLGTPTVRGWLQRSDSSQPDDDALVFGFDVDNRTDEAGLAVTFAQEKISWGLEAAIVDYIDSSDEVVLGGYLVYEPPSDSRNVQSSLQISWAPAARVMLDAYLQRNNFKESDYGSEYQSANFGLNGSFLLVPQKLTLAVSANRGQDRRKFGSLMFLPEHVRSRFASAQMNWQIREAVHRQPGVDVYFKGNIARHEDLAFLLDEDTWSLFIGANVSWAHK
jgi:hypothetical protein